MSLGLAVVFFGCQSAPLTTSLDGGLPDFALVDENTGSATHGQSISPSQFAGRVSGWYFAHST